MPLNSCIAAALPVQEATPLYAESGRRREEVKVGRIFRDARSGCGGGERANCKGQFSASFHVAHLQISINESRASTNRQPPPRICHSLSPCCQSPLPSSYLSSLARLWLVATISVSVCMRIWVFVEDLLITSLNYKFLSIGKSKCVYEFVCLTLSYTCSPKYFYYFPY